MTASGFEAQSSTVAHFGIKKYKKVDEVIITWPDGSTETHNNLDANTHYLIKKETSRLR
jgi:hypothetical protein